ncbi:MDR family MFS transporter [Marinactinospora thermotolerans]|uniref:Drug resistance transporter, EmrB/QacA subfamily n=1 Tax=Marinactinospora thermotolerans DSM 45154 TaxID=1122192 RepID=A0A1T4MV19_9ACTN|nr:MDR family MFS transporter [Marinactinospora thermotolerans]SJZ70741.1 drug resistance transporter, EmrB/QacA subfamily [Marinactinospora thermotolerans DSM 45154]
MAKHAASYRRRRQAGETHVLVIVGALLLAVLVSALNQTVVSTAMPTIVSDLGGLSHISWVVTSYLLAVTATTPLWGKLGDQFGRKGLFLLCIVIFLVGSALCGLARTFEHLILFRAVQGVGGGGLMVLAQAIIGDVVPPRERGRYQGLFGAVFGVASVAGPLLGGFIVDNLSWRWVFYVNLPLGVVALVVLVFVLPALRPDVRRTDVDYAGIVLLGATSVALVLITSWGGTTYDWISPQIIGLAVAAVILGALWWLSARRAAEPVLPLGLFRNPVILVGVLVSFAVGFAMMGALAYLPLFLQVVHGYSPTASGLHLLPMVLGLLLCSIGSGILVSRTGHYRLFPIVGTAVVTVALYLLSHLRPDTSVWVMSGYFFLLGVGLGLTMQVVVIAVQNAAEYRDLGVATSAATFFRSIGGAFGTSIFGAVFAAQLEDNISELAGRIQVPAGMDIQRLQNETGLLAQLPAESRELFLGAYADSVDTVFLAAVPVAAIAFLLSLFLRQVPLRTTVGTPDLDETIAPVATSRDRLAAVERMAWRISGRQGGRRMYERLAGEAHVDLSPAACWLVTHMAVTGPITGEELARLSKAREETLDQVHQELTAARLLADESSTWRLNAHGRDVARRLFEAQDDALHRALRDYSPEEHPELVALLYDLSRRTLGEESDAELVRDPGPARPL